MAVAGWTGWSINAAAHVSWPPCRTIASQGDGIGVFSTTGSRLGVVVRNRKPALLWALLVAAFPALAQEDMGLGPWRLGMSKEQVVSLAEQGPYSDAASGSMETASAPFAAGKVKATLTFGTAGLAGVKFPL